MSNKPKRDPVKDAAQKLQQVVPPPSESFAAGVEAAANARRMDPAYGDAYGLGEFISPQENSEAVDLHGHAVPVAFPLYYRRHFAKQTPERLNEVDEMIDERLDREAVNRHREAIAKQRRVWRRGAWIGFGTMVIGGKWIVEQFTWVNEQLPALKMIWDFIVRAKT